MMSISDKIKSNPKLKKLVQWMLVSSYKPRLWVRIFINPFKHTRGKSSVVRWKTRLDLFPFHKFELGENSLVEDFSVINNGVGDVHIGSDTIVGISNIIIGPVEIGNNVMLAQHIVISGLNHGYSDPVIPPSRQPVVTAKIVIEDDVWIGANSVVTAGVRIGKHSIVGGGSVVAKDIPEYCVVVGNPARIIKRFNFETATWDKIDK
ncbi:DapH/DapD/GlmU-related protein [Pedobacter foliorum]|uniref:acyltransferase n=1 Tax=Pedobacter foliorum TaxID=2739058 RepID=UPI001FEB6D70|nr:acyltransferase [Pedobacter foliorum]